MVRLLVYGLFLTSGAAALVYEVAWTRSLGLVFGASHLAVATVLAVYMGGQALGSALVGQRADRSARPLRLYGYLELAVAASAVLFVGLMRLYPIIYRPLAQFAEENRLYVTALQTTFAVAALIVPTTLMGATLPMLVSFVMKREGGLGRRLSFLYAFNTLGAVVGTALAGFYLLEAVGVTSSLLLAAGVSAAVGVAAIVLDRRVVAPAPEEPAPSPAAASAPESVGDDGIDLPLRLTLLGVGVSGFCALGYEVLWTRTLSLVTGTSVYSFTIMLVTFLTGIGAGSLVYGLVHRRLGAGGQRGSVFLFAATQVVIGLTALAATVLMKDLPGTAGRLQGLMGGVNQGLFGGRVLTSFLVAFSYMFFPAFFMGVAFPAAGHAWAEGRRRVAGAIGSVLAVNTIGAILGSLVSGFALIYLLGVERSLHVLVAVNVGAGLAVALATSGRRWLVVTAGVATALVIAIRFALPEWGRAWDQKYFATYLAGAAHTETPDRIRERLRDVEVLYFHEGVNETVAVTRPRGGFQAFVVNGRPEASNHPMDVQCQRTLGHVPMLLHPNPKKVFVLGTGSGMTLGATSLHPEVEQIVLAEIEPGVLGVARTFADWNSRVLDDPKLRIVFNDGRNFLATTREKFDVITADPIHPWSGGAAYLYTAEYFRSVSDRLAPGGIACQWLPLYELTTRDVKTVLRTFTGAFRHVMVWLTYYDAEIIASNDPIVIDEAALARRMAVPAIRADLEPVYMGSPQDLLQYFVLGDAGARAFARGGDVNTDDNLRLEFSAPMSQGVPGLSCDNVLALGAQRESLLPYLVPAPAGPAREAQVARWTNDLVTARLFDPVHAEFMCRSGSPALPTAIDQLQSRDPGYAPLRFLREEKVFRDGDEPALVREATFRIQTRQGLEGTVRLAAVRQYSSRQCALVSYAEPARRVIFAQRSVCARRFDELDGEVARRAEESLAVLRAAVEAVGPVAPGAAPAEENVLQAIRTAAAKLPGNPG